MNFHPIDLIIIALYLIANALLGIYIRKEATKHTQAYFLGDRNVNWWMLRLSGCSSYIDVSGTIPTSSSASPPVWRKGGRGRRSSTVSRVWCRD
ncbi:MAG: hypothetical protein AB1428_07295 [Bacteroidota bacterium]